MRACMCARVHGSCCLSHSRGLRSRVAWSVAVHTGHARSRAIVGSGRCCCFTSPTPALRGRLCHACGLGCRDSAATQRRGLTSGPSLKAGSLALLHSCRPSQHQEGDPGSGPCVSALVLTCRHPSPGPEEAAWRSRVHSAASHLPGAAAPGDMGLGQPVPHLWPGPLGAPGTLGGEATLPAPWPWDFQKVTLRSPPATRPQSWEKLGGRSIIWSCFCSSFRSDPTVVQ